MERVEDLLVHADLVRSVARAVLHGDDRVDDVVQDTWVASMRSGPGEPGSERGWLSRVSQRFALMVRRGDASRRRRETAAVHRDEGPSTAEIAEREESRRRVLEAVLALEEPFRRAVLLRYYDGLAPREIAARLGIPVETARSRVRRGLERLRERLVADAEPCDRRNLALLASMPAAAVAVPLLGGLLMAKKAIAVGALLLLTAGGTWWAVTRESDDGRGPSASTDARPAESAPALATTEGTPPSPTAPAGGADRATSPAPVATEGADRTTLRGRLSPFDPSLPGRAALVVTGLADWPDEVHEPLRAQAQPDGTFRVDVGVFVDGPPRAQELEVLVDHPAYAPAVARLRSLEPKDLDVVVALARAGALSGRVVGPAGAPVAGAYVGLLTDEVSSAVAVDATRTDAEGAFRVRAGRDGRYLLVVDADGLAPALQREAVVVASERSLAPIVLAAGAEISGTARAPELPAVALEVEASPESLGQHLSIRNLQGDVYRTLTTDGTRAEKGDVRARVSASGEFRIGGLGRGPHRLQVELDDEQRAPGKTFVHSDLAKALERRVEAPAAGIELELRGALLVLEISTPKGPPSKASVYVDRVTESADDHGSLVSLGVDGAGRARLLVRPQATYRIRAQAEGFSPVTRTVRTPAVGGEHVERIAMVPAEGPKRRLVLRLSTEAGADPGVKKVAARLLPPGGAPDAAPSVTLAFEEGRFVWNDPPAGRHRLEVSPAGTFLAGTTPWLDAEAAVDVPETGEAEAALRLTLGGWLVLSAKAPDGSLLDPFCRVLDGSGASRARYFVVRVPGGGSMGHSAALSVDGPAQVEPALPPGTYTVELSHDDYLSKRVEVAVKRGETTTLEIPLVPK